MLRIAVISIIAAQLAAVPGVWAACTGDCDGSGEVLVSELITSVNLALGRFQAAGCEAADPDRDGRVGVVDLIEAVSLAESGCPDTPTPTFTGGVTVTPTATPTVTPTQTPTGAPTVTPTATPSETVASPTSTSTVTATSTPTVTSTSTPIRVPTGAGRFRDVAVSSQVAVRLAISTFGHLSLLHNAGTLAEGSCTNGGSAAVSCETTQGGVERTTVYDDCRSTTPGGHAIVRNGTLIETVSSCEVQGDPTNVELVTFRLEERAAGGEVLLSFAADLRISIMSLGRQGCAGADISERIDGTVHLQCGVNAEVVACTEAVSDVMLEATGLTLERISLGNPCQEFFTARGGLAVEDGTRAEDFTQVFQGLTVSRKPGSGNDDEIRIDGEMSVDCLGALSLTTKSSSPILVARGSSCPRGGEISLGRPAESASPTARRNDVLSAALETPGAGFREFLFRAAAGQVYQVIQNEDAANGADAIQITSLVGALRSSVALCSNTAGSDADPMAVAVTGAGSAYPLASIVRSVAIAGTTLPRFNRNAEQGSGRVCVGEDCSEDAGCPDGGDCTSFVLDDGAAIAQIEPPARLVTPNTSCGNFPSRATFAFGSGGPTLETPLCSPAPVDGIRLELGSTLIVAYDTQPLELFNAGVGGLPIDTVSGNSLCPGPGVLSPGRTLSDTAAAPIVAFSERGASLDYDGDGAADRVLADCGVPAKIECTEPEDPTPTPTIAPNLPCGATDLGAVAEIDLMSSTVGRPLSAGGASCGWGGGNAAPDHVFRFVAPMAGVYDFELEATGFTPLLYARDVDCSPGRAQLGCVPEDTEDAGPLHLTLELAQDQEIALVVDGNDDVGGSFRLRGRRQQPDLVIQPGSVRVMPATARAGDRVSVRATVVNRGDGGAGSFAVDFLLSRDAAGADIVSVAPLRCAVSGGLAAQASFACEPENDMNLPLIAPGPYFVVALADGRTEIDESSDGNNVGSVALTVGPAPGVVLDQQIFRAGDGTIYQVLRALPQITTSTAASYRITTVAGSFEGGTACEVSGAVSGADAVAAVGGVSELALDAVRKTAILRPNAFGEPFFDAGQGGHLILGSGGAMVEVCARAEVCSGTDLVNVQEGGVGPPAACKTTLVGVEDCSGHTTMGFARADGQCGGGFTTAATQICNAEPVDGFELQPGEAIVFVYFAGRDAFEVGVGAFGTAEPGDGRLCPGVVEAKTIREPIERAPLLALIGTQTGAESQLVALSPDDRHAYLTGNGFLRVFRRSEDDGLLEPIQELLQGANGVRGLELPASISVSPEGRHVYVSGNNAVTTFGRDQDEGTLTFTELKRGIVDVGGPVLAPDGLHAYVPRIASKVSLLSRDQLGGSLNVAGSFGSVSEPLSLVVSPDGANVYVLDSGMVIVFARMTPSGALMQLETKPSVGSILLLSPDGRHLYAAGGNAVTLFARDEDDGRLLFVRTDVVDDPEAFFRVARLSPDGLNLYGAGTNLFSFRRDPGSGLLDFEEAETLDVFPQTSFNEAASIEISADGEFVYLTGTNDLVLVILDRNLPDGRLAVVDVQRDVGGELSATNDIAMSPDGRHVYTGSFLDEAVVVSARDRNTGMLSFVEAKRDGVDGVVGLFEPNAIALSDDGKNVYVGDTGFRTLLAFTRNVDSGKLGIGEIFQHPDGPGPGRPPPRVEGATVVPGLVSPAWVDVSPDGRHVYVSSGAVFSRDLDSGDLTFSGSSAASADQIILSPDGRHAYLNGSDVLVAKRDADGQLEIDGSAPVPELAFPRSLALSGDGSNVYAVYRIEPEATAAVIAFARDGENGKLMSIDRDDVGLDPFFVSVAPDGRFVYVSGSGGVAVFRRLLSGGLVLEEVQNDGLESTAAASLAVSPDGRHVYAAQGSGIVAFELTE